MLRLSVISGDIAGKYGMANDQLQNKRDKDEEQQGCNNRQDQVSVITSAVIQAFFPCERGNARKTKQ